MKFKQFTHEEWEKDKGQKVYCDNLELTQFKDFKLFNGWEYVGVNTFGCIAIYIAEDLQLEAKTKTVWHCVYKTKDSTCTSNLYNSKDEMVLSVGGLTKIIAIYSTEIETT